MSFDPGEIRDEIETEVGSIPWVSASIIGISYLVLAFIVVPIVMILDVILISPEGSILPETSS